MTDDLLPRTRAEAKRLGEQFYLTGKLCKGKRGPHSGPRYASNGQCVVCKREEVRERRWERLMQFEPGQTEEFFKAEAERTRQRDPERERERNRERHRRRTTPKQLRRDRTPPWLSTDERNAIDAFYDACPEGMLVDHIVPFLHAGSLAGLHVLANLQYLTVRQNNRKGPRLDMTPEEAADLVRRGIAIWTEDAGEGGEVNWAPYAPAGWTG